MQRVTLDIGTSFQIVEGNLQDAFLQDLFKGATSQIPGRTVTGLPVKQARIELPDPNQTARANWTASCFITGHLVTALPDVADFWSGDDALLMGEVRDEIRQRNFKDVETALGEAWAAMSMEDALRIG